MSIAQCDEGLSAASAELTILAIIDLPDLQNDNRPCLTSNDLISRAARSGRK